MRDGAFARGSRPRRREVEAMHDAHDRPEPGQILFGRYRVERPIGEGGLGSVWLVQHLELEAPRALKLIASNIASDAHGRARFRRDAEALARLSHPNLV